MIFCDSLADTISELAGIVDSFLTETEPAEVTPETQERNASETAGTPSQTLDENGSYTKNDMALCMKKGAEALGWSGGSLEPYAPPSF